MSPQDPHPWLGLDFGDLLPGLSRGEHRFTLSVTRPFGYSYGAGRMRVVKVIPPSSTSPDEVTHLVIAYERYFSFPAPIRTGRKEGKSRGSGSVPTSPQEADESPS